MLFKKQVWYNKYVQKAPIPKNEKERLEAVHSLGILDTKPEERFDVLTKEAVKKLKAPMAMVSIIDSGREWFKSCAGSAQKEGKRDVSFCGHAILSTDVFIVRDTLKDERFKDNPMVVNSPFIRFYAGIVLHDKKTNLPVGVFCIKDTKSRTFNEEETSILMDLAERAEKELNK
jgi:GAF domain-containing protein